MSTPEDEIRELIHAQARPQLQSQWVGAWLLRHGFPAAEANAAVSALISGMPRQQLSDAVWERYTQLQAGDNV